MAYSAITDAQITAGEACKGELFDKIQDNFANHQTRITSLEGATTLYQPLQFIVKGGHYLGATATTGLEYFRIWSSITITGSTLIIMDTGSSGDLTVDVQYKNGASAFTTIYTTKPTLNNTAAQFDTNSGTLIGSPDLVSGDILRLDVDEFMDGNYEFHLYLDYAAT